MKVLGIVDRRPDRDALETALDRVVDRLTAVGRVGVVRYDATIADGSAHVDDRTVGGEVNYELGADGDWAATGTGKTIGGVLDTLAPDCEYAVVAGLDPARFPAIEIGQATVDADESGHESGSEPASEAVSESEPAPESKPGSESEPATEPASTPAPPARIAVEDAGAIDTDAVLEVLEASEPYETLESLVASVKASSSSDLAGAIATFTGRVRAKDDPADTPTEYLEFEKYDGVADDRMATIERELEAREAVYAVRCHHRTGVLHSGTDIVFVVVLAGHREQAFRAVEDGINRLKDEVPLFKKEVTVEDEFWVHEGRGPSE